MAMISWNDFNDEDKKELRGLRAIFIMAPRSLSKARLLELVKTSLAKGNVIFGVAEEPYVDGFEGQPQFKFLPLESVSKLADAVDEAESRHKFYVISYPQLVVDEVIRAIRPHRVVVVRGSYKYPFHRSSTCALLEKRGITFEYASPFVDELEALAYLKTINSTSPSKLSSTRSSTRSDPVQGPTLKELKDEGELLNLVGIAAAGSFDYSFQTGALLAEKTKDGYTVIDSACNEVVPYQTYALHFGNSRETHRSAHQSDATHYDTIHAEMNLLVRAMKNGTSFEGKTLVINMMPCPNCARTLIETGLSELLYHEVHSDGYAVKLFEKAGIKTRKVDAI